MVERHQSYPVRRLPRTAARSGARGLPHLYRGARSTTGRKVGRDVYAADHGDMTGGGRFRWLLTTCLAATVGAIAILVVIYGSADGEESTAGLLPVLKRMRDAGGEPPIEALLARSEGLKWASPKSDRLQVTSGSLSTRFVIHETVKQRRNGREYIHAKPYVRIVSRFAPVPPNFADVIPPFNPVKLYANNRPIGSAEEAEAQDAERQDVDIKVVELLGGILPGEDGQELDNDEVAELVERSEQQPASTPAIEPADPFVGGKPSDSAPEAEPHVSVLVKSTADVEVAASEEIEGIVRTVRTIGAGDKLSKLLVDAGAETWQAKSMIEAMNKIVPESALTQGSEVHISLAPSLTQPGRKDPIRFSVFGEGHQHKVTVSRGADGEFAASAEAIDTEEIMRTAFGTASEPQSSSLYASLYHAALVQNVEPETIQSILRVNAYDVDFRRRVRAGDGMELFFDLKDDDVADGPPGELLFASVMSGGEQRRFWRYRTPDGQVDFYDENGNNAKRFLMRKPVRGDDVRLTSGYGVRFHPLLNERRMHTGVDWACSPGTPILASGNGVIEEAGRKGQYGNYVRIRHANGYQTAYGHMSRLAAGAEVGVKVRQGQVIGYVGSTGLSSGPHLHFEVLVNSRFVDPMSIQVPRERQLEGRDLGEFQKERARIDDLMRRSPVMASSK